MSNNNENHTFFYDENHTHEGVMYTFKAQTKHGQNTHIGARR